MYIAECHCGAVRIELEELPATVTSCNCSICRRYGALWAYTTRNRVDLRTDGDVLATYSWGDRSIEFCHCRRCGCLTHYESADKHGRHRFAVNARMLPPEATESLPVRHFDGARSWKYVD